MKFTDVVKNASTKPKLTESDLQKKVMDPGLRKKLLERDDEGTAFPHKKAGDPAGSSCCEIGTDMYSHAAAADDYQDAARIASAGGNDALALAYLELMAEELRLARDAYEQYMAKGCERYSVEDHCATPGGTKR